MELKRILLFTIMALQLFACGQGNTQVPDEGDKPIGGPCEGCEAIFEYGTKELYSIDTMPGFNTTDINLHISGTVYHIDGITPASNVIVYAYHTNKNGIYETTGIETGWGRRHGKHRGWIKTGKNGQFSFLTCRPGSYPNRNEPEHVHFVVKEPDLNEYYIDDLVFTDDPLLTPEKQRSKLNRAGSGIATPITHGNLQSVQRDIILGLQIPNHPKSK